VSRRHKAQTPEAKKHIQMLHTLPCMITQHEDIKDWPGQPQFITVHHVHGGSMLEVDGFENPGWGQKSSDWLAIPLHEIYHTGAIGIDKIGVEVWERNNAPQVRLIDKLCCLLEMDLWIRAGIKRELPEL